MLPVVSLFTGAGGLDLGIEAAGRGAFEFRAWVENDPDCRRTLEQNNPAIRQAGSFFDDIESIDPVELRRAARLDKEEAFLVVGGPPCQAFSTAGLRKSVQSEQGRVVHNYFDVIQELRPRFFVFENVRGLLSAALVHRPLSERVDPREIPDDDDERLGSVMKKVIIPSFARMGYEIVYGILCSADYGTAQVRHRVVILGSRDKEFRSGVFRKQTGRRLEPLDMIPATHHRLAPYPPIGSWRTLWDAVGHLPKTPRIEDAYSYSAERAAVFSHIPPGGNWKWVRDNQSQFPRGYLKKIMGGAMTSGGGKEGFWRRLSWEQPTPTLTTQPQQLASSLCHPEQLRPLSIPEYAAVQDFPPDYVFTGSKAARYRQIGNAVPVRMASAIGASILAVAGVRV